MGVMERSMSWTGGLSFEGKGVYGLQLVTDVTKAVGGNESGFTPSELSTRIGVPSSANPAS